MKIVLTGGGTGGHIMPLVAVSRKIRERNIGAEFIFIGPKGDLEKKIMEAEGIPIKNILTGKIRRYASWLNFLDIFRAPIGIIQALWHLLWIMPDAIFSKGGGSSMPVVVAGWLYRIPILIHESDAKPGMANSALAKFASRVAVSYPDAEDYFPNHQVLLTGTPLRSDINQGDANKARIMFSFTDLKKVIFVWGGSQGAREINMRFVEILPKLLHEYQIVHQTGINNFEETKQIAGELGIKAGRDGYYPIAFIGEELKDILAVTDLVISRAGSNSISEIAANAKPSIIIPIEKSANDHQRMNAYSIAKEGGCEVLEEGNLGENILLEKINEIMHNGELQNKLKQGIQKFYHPDAAEKIANGILEMIK